MRLVKDLSPPLGFGGRCETLTFEKALIKMNVPVEPDKTVTT